MEEYLDPVHLPADERRSHLPARTLLCYQDQHHVGYAPDTRSKDAGIDDRATLCSYLYPEHVVIDPKVREFMDGIVSELDFESTSLESILEFYSAKLNKTKESVL